MMQRIYLDTAVLIAADRNDARAAHLKRHFTRDGIPLNIPTVVLAQAWRSSRSSANIARYLRGTRFISEITPPLARRAGELQAKTGTSDAVDAILVALAEPGGDVITGDVDDLSRLATHAVDVRIREF